MKEMEGGEEKQFEGCRRIYIFDFVHEEKTLLLLLSLFLRLKLCQFYCVSIAKVVFTFAHSFHSPSFLPHFVPFFIVSNIHLIFFFLINGYILMSHIQPSISPIYHPHTPRAHSTYWKV